MSGNRRVRGSKVRDNFLMEKDVDKKKKANIFDGVVINWDFYNEQEESDLKRTKPQKIRKDVISDNVVQENVKMPIRSKSDIFSDNDCFREKRYKRVRAKKIRGIVFDKEEKRLDKEIEGQDNLSIIVMIIILVFCFIVGITLGYLLYQIAINSSNVMMVVRNFF